jgi:hypothetical protein
MAVIIFFLPKYFRLSISFDLGKVSVSLRQCGQKQLSEEWVLDMAPVWRKKQCPTSQMSQTASLLHWHPNNVPYVLSDSLTYTFLEEPQSRASFFEKNSHIISITKGFMFEPFSLRREWASFQGQAHATHTKYYCVNQNTLKGELLFYSFTGLSIRFPAPDYCITLSCCSKLPLFLSNTS